jgi:hypothetical protein
MRQYGTFRHTSQRDWRRCLRATGSGTFASAAAINLGQTFTISAMVYLASYGTALAVWNVASGAGIRFTITTTGAISLNNGTDAAIVSAAAVVPLMRWVKVETTFDGARRVVHRVDGEPVHSATMAGTTAWTAATTVAMTVPLGCRVTRLQAWRRVLTLAESRADFYSWTGPVADVSFPLDNQTTSTTTVAGTDGGVALGAASITNMVWSDDVPSQPVRGPRAWGYSFSADHNGTNPTDIRPASAIMPAALIALLQGKTGLTLGCRIKVQGAQSSSFRPIVIGVASSGTGPSIRMDCTTAAGQIRLTFNGKPGGSASSTIAPTTVDIRDRLLGRWAHIGFVLDYAGNTITAYLDGLPIALDSNTLVGGLSYHPEAVDGTEPHTVGAANATAAMRTLQTDHIVCAKAATGAEMRALALYGTAPGALAMRLLLTEGVGTTTTESVLGTTYTLTRNGVADSALWRPDAP